MKKKLVTGMLAASMIAALTACGGSTSNTASTQQDTAAASAASTAAAEAATGSTEAAEAETQEIPVHDAAYTEVAHSATKKHDKIQIAMDVNPGNLSPEAVSDSGGALWKWNVYEHLFDINGFGGELVPATAEKYEKIDDTTYRVYLYKGVTDSDGNELHADDVIAAYDTLVAAGNRMSGDIAKYDHGEVVDDYTVDLVMKEPLTGLSDLTSILGQPYVYTQQAAKDHNLSTDPCGTGPYKVTDFQAGSSITEEARDDYWAEGTDHQSQRECANVQTIEYKVVSEAAQNAIGLQTGDLDFSSYVSATDIANFKEGGSYADNFFIDTYLDNLTTALFINNDASKSQGADENLRAAIYYALDGTQLAQASGVADFVRASTLGNAKYPEFQEAWLTDNNYYNVQDLELAQQYLSKSSYDGSTLTIIMNNEQTMTNVATAIQAMLENIGIHTELDAEDGSIIDSKQVNGDYDLILTQMASDNYLPIIWQRWYSEDFHSVSHTINNCDDPQIQTLVDTVNTVDGDTPENVSAFHDYIIQNYYGYGLYSKVDNNVVTNEIVTPCWNYQDYIVPGGCIYSDNEF